ncbi:MAG: membrane fusion protein (multidrug efflux system) [Planctomycetota bacterium]
MEASGQVVNGLTPRSIPIVDEKVRSFTLILDITGEVVRKNKLRPGMSISAMVPLGKASDQIVVPKDAILRRGTDALIVKVGEGNVAELIPVRILFDSEASFAIEPLVPGGIEPGDLVVVEGNERIYPGTPVTPIVKGKEQEGAAPAPEETGTEQPRD